jgi:1-acyl-sn-glycerol-3-phosphate acyltransferase
VTAAPSVPSHRLLTLVRGIAFIIGSVITFWVYALCRGPFARWRRPIQVGWCRGCLRLMGLRLKTFGTPAPDRQVLYVGNHVSYLDIPVLSRLIAGTFIAKAEVASWPLFGFAARITGTVFVNRVSAEAMAQRQALVARLAAGEHLILFPEGTSTDGSRVAPFKSSLFGLAENPALRETLVIQPFSLAYTRAHDGTPLVGPLRALYCWFGEGTLLPHICRVLGMRGGEVEVRFHPPIPAAAGNRKVLARLAGEAVQAGVQASFEPLLREAGGEAAAGAAAAPSPLTRAGDAASA